VNRCRRCKAPIAWARTSPAGRPIPLDPEPVARGNVAIVGHAERDLMDTPAGHELVVLVLGATMLATLPPDTRLYRSHFATCPYADAFRRRR